MESKTLSNIQRCMKIGNVFSKIGFVFTIVGFIGCMVGIVCLSIFPQNETIQLGSVTIHGIIQLAEKEGMNIPSCYTSMIIGMVLCLFEGNLLKSASTYFKNELKAGTPFTMTGAQELKRLGIKTIVLPLVSVIVCQIVYQVMNHYYPEIMDMHIDSMVSIGTGIALLFLSMICRYGAEMETNKD